MAKEKKTILLEDYLSNMITRDLQIDHNSDKQLPKFISSFVYVKELIYLNRIS